MSKYKEGDKVLIEVEIKHIVEKEDIRALNDTAEYLVNIPANRNNYLIWIPEESIKEVKICKK